MKPLLSALVLTYNESLHISRCINNLKQVTDDVIVVDSFSKDDTVSIAKSLGAKVYQNEFVNHAKQFNWALDNVEFNSEWIIRLDADEYLEKPLIEEILNELPKLPSKVNGLILKRKVWFHKKNLRFGGVFPQKILRIWRNGKAQMENRSMDEHILIRDGETAHFENFMVDHNLNNIDWWTLKHINYAKKEALEHLERVKLHDCEEMGTSKNQHIVDRDAKRGFYYRMPVFVRPFVFFFYRYVLRLGFLDGRSGFMFHFLQGFWYRVLVDVMILEQRKKS